ncbi:MAG: hypothetical protein J6D54_00965 [Olsenella sp.]|nr:hypothetical protein [Olsenella sp.]
MSNDEAEKSIAVPETENGAISDDAESGTIAPKTESGVTAAEAMRSVTVPNLSDLPAIPESALDLTDSIKIPLSKLTSLGVAFASLPDAFRTVTQTVTSANGEILYRAMDAKGNILSPSQLYAFKDGSGLLGSIKQAGGDLAQARFEPVTSVAKKVTTSIPYDPTTLVAAAALMQINAKLDDIKELQQKMFEYAKLQERATLLAGFAVLDEVRESYRFNSDNQTYLASRHNSVADVRKDAERAIVLQRTQLAEELHELGLIHLSTESKRRVVTSLGLLRDYQLAAYLYAYSTLMDVMLVGNFEHDYLESVHQNLEKHALEYRELYTKLLDRVEQDANSSVAVHVAKGLSAFGSGVGRLIASTPVGDATPIDEAVMGGAKMLDGMADGVGENYVKALSTFKPGFEHTFAECVQDIDRLHNRPLAVVMGGESIYVLPAGGGDVA